MSVLADNIFINSRYQQYEDYGNTQSYFDSRTGIIYIVMEEYGMTGNCIIQEITEDSPEYKANYERYKKAMGIEEEYTVSFLAQIDTKIKASSSDEARKKAKRMLCVEYNDFTDFTGAYLSDIGSIIDKNGEEVN